MAKRLSFPVRPPICFSCSRTSNYCYTRSCDDRHSACVSGMENGCRSKEFAPITVATVIGRA